MIVRRGSERVGRLSTIDGDGVVELDRPISLRLGGVRERRLVTRGVSLHPFFAGLLPEGIRLRAIERRLGRDPFTLLSAIGSDCIGDVSVEADEAHAFDAGRAAEVSFRDLFDASIAGTHGVEPALSGAQEKIAAADANGHYILKLNPPKAPRIVENEHFFLRAAAEIGMEAASATIVRDREGESGLLVRRFDRDGDTRIPQEDACQFLDRYPDDKYALATSDVMKGVVELASAPSIASAKLLRLVAFSYLIANGDLHAKNVSLRTVDGRVDLAPGYDLLSTLPYGDRTMALPLEGRKDNLRRSTFVAFGQRFGLPERAVTSILDRLCDAAPSWIGRLDEIGLADDKRADLARVIAKRRTDLGAP